MSNEIAVQMDYSIAPLVKAHGKNYTVSMGERKLELVRDVDFGVIPGTKQPSLLKSGCERLVMSAGLTQNIVVENAIEDYSTPFFMYRVRCDLVAYIDGVERLITSGYGSANSNERQNGRASAFDSANRVIKMARKRAISDACLTAFQLSAAFTQDMETLENSGALDPNAKIDVVREDDVISAKQIKRLFTIASQAGVTDKAAGEVIKRFGYESSKAIKNRDYDAICEAIKEVKA